MICSHPRNAGRKFRRLHASTGLAWALGLLAAVAWPATTLPAGDEDVIRLHLMWTNDVHGHIAPEGARFMNPNFPPPLGGGASAARYIKQVRTAAAARGEPVLLVDVGDMFQGTPIGSKTEGDAVIAYFNAVGYDFAVPGNHDFDMGRDVTEKLARASRFPWVCANLIEEETGEVVDWCVPTLMLEVAGLKIGVIGIITPGTASMSFPDNIRGLKFLPMPETIEKYRDRLRADGAELIFLAIHEGLPFDPKEGWAEIARTQEEATDDHGTYGGYSQYGGLNLMELVNIVSGIDFAVGGHTHRGYNEPWIDPIHHTLCFETFGNGSSLGHAILEIDRRTRGLIGYDRPHDRGTIVTLFEDELWPDADITEVIRPWLELTDAEMDKVVGRTAANLGRGDAGTSLVGNLVTDAMVDFFTADFSFQNLGGLRADLPAGDITARDIFGVLPFGNELVIVRMLGEMMLRVVERKLQGSGNGICIAGAEIAYDGDRPNGERVVSFLVGDEPLDLQKEYKVVTVSFLMEGNSGLDFLTIIPEENVQLTQVTTAEAVEHYLQLNSPVHPRIDSRWVERRGATRAAYLEGPPPV
jgi:2',3'-cyclic-nucleotide 2'-phosphodiesterase (5'-nucleotidase family)